MPLCFITQMASSKLDSMLKKSVITEKDLAQLRVQELKVLCEAHSISASPSGKRGLIKRDYIQGLLSRVSDWFSSN